MKILITENQLTFLLKEESKKLITPPLLNGFRNPNDEMKKEYFDKILDLVKQGLTPYNAFTEAGFEVGWDPYRRNEKNKFYEYMSYSQFQTLTSARNRYLKSKRPKGEIRVGMEIKDFTYNPDNIINPKYWVIKDMSPDETRASILYYYNETYNRFFNKLKKATIYTSPRTASELIAKGRRHNPSFITSKVVPISDEDYQDYLEDNKTHNDPSIETSVTLSKRKPNVYRDYYGLSGDAR